MTDDIFAKLHALPAAAHLARLAQTAVQLYPEDANTVLIKLRQFGEATLQYLAERWQIDTTALDSQHELLMLLEYKLIIPPDIIDHLHALRKTGNRAVHEWHDDLADADANLQHARHIAHWLWQTFALPEKKPAEAEPKPAKARKPKKTATPTPDAEKRAAERAARQAEKARLRAQAKAEREAEREAEKRAKQAQREAHAQQYREKKARRAERLQTLRARFEQGMALELHNAYPQAFAHYLDAAERGYVPAMTKLGLFYATGKGTATDPEAASHWNHLAAKKGDPIACNNLANLYARGEGVAQNTTRALELYHRAARKGYAPAQYNLGNTYRKGEIVARNLALAASWYKKAAAQNLDVAHYWLGYLYERGYGVRQNPGKAESHYRQAAENGHLDAQLALADLHLKKEHGEKDYRQAAYWFHKAALQGDPRAQHNLAIILGMGLGDVVQNVIVGEYWLAKAAEQNHPDTLAFIKERFPDGL